MKEVLKCLQYLFQTKNEVTFCVGNCKNGMELILTNLIHRTDSVLVAVIGETGKQALNFIQNIATEVNFVKSSVGQSLDYKTIEANLNKFQPKVFFIVNGECSTGVLQPISKLGELCRK